jgi:hypothetical protein
MHLLGHFTNPSAPLVAVFEALPDVPLEPAEQPTLPPETGRLGNGEVKRAVVKALAEADRPMRAADIHLAVERLLGRPISKNSVGWCLAAGAKGKVPRFERAAYGSYRLVSQT